MKKDNIFTRRVNSNLNKIVENLNPIRIYDYSAEELEERIDKFFDQYEGETIVEFEKSNNLFNKIFKFWNPTNKNPMKFHSVSINNNSPNCKAYLSFNSDLKSNGTNKYLLNDSVISFDEGILYYGIMHPNKSNELRLYVENLYVPESKFEELNNPNFKLSNEF